jgi:hypothetical protein
MNAGSLPRNCKRLVARRAHRLQFAAEQYLISLACGPPFFPQVFGGHLTTL